MKKAVINLWPSRSPSVTDGLNGKYMMTIGFSEVAPAQEECLSKKLSSDLLKKEPGLFQILEKKAQGYPNGLWNLAVCYDCGIGIKQDPDLANAHYLMAWTLAQLDEGKIILKDPDEKAINIVPFTPTYEAYSEAALKGYPIATYQAGLCLLTGTGVKEDDVMAVAFFTLSFAAGFMEAASALGDCFLRGYGVEPDMKKALSLFQTAANGGSAEGKYQLGVLRYNGGQKEEGAALIKEAAELGFPQAKKALKSLNGSIPNQGAAKPVTDSKTADSFFPSFSAEQIYQYMTHKDESQKDVTALKAMKYVNEGRLFDLRFNDAGTWFAVKVHGSNGNVYDTELLLSNDKSQIIDCRCSCPSYLRWHSPCKHIVALLIYLTRKHYGVASQDVGRSQETESKKITKSNAKQSETETSGFQNVVLSAASEKTKNERPKNFITKLCVTSSLDSDNKTVLLGTSSQKTIQSSLEFINQRLTPEELKEIPDVFEKLKENCLGHSNALWNLALCYDIGIGTSPSLTLAGEFYLRAYLQKKIDAGELNQKRLLREGPKPMEASLKLKAFFDAAKLGYKAANYWTGICYLKGRGIFKDPQTANLYFRKASDLGCGEASAILAENYEKGIGIEKSYRSAQSFGELAHRQGCDTVNIAKYDDLVYCTRCGTVYEKKQIACPFCLSEGKANGIPSQEEESKLEMTKNEIFSGVEDDLSQKSNELGQLERRKEHTESVAKRLFMVFSVSPLLVPPIVFLIALLCFGNITNVPHFIWWAPFVVAAINFLLIFFISKGIVTRLDSQIRTFEGEIDELKGRLDNMSKFK